MRIECQQLWEEQNIYVGKDKKPASAGTMLKRRSRCFCSADDTMYVQ